VTYPAQPERQAPPVGEMLDGSTAMAVPSAPAQAVPAEPAGSADPNEPSQPTGSTGPTQPAVSSAPARQRGLFPQTLAARLALGVVALVVVLVIATGAAIYALLQPFLLDRLDQQLLPIAASNASIVGECLAVRDPSDCVIGSQPANQLAPKAAQREWINTYIADGVPVLPFGSSEDVTELQLSTDDLTALMQRPTRLRTVTTQDGFSVRVTGRLVQTRIGAVVVVSGLSTNEVSHTLQRLLRLEVAIGAAGVALAAGLTTWGVRAGLRPLHRVTRTAQDVTAELGPEGSGLDRRVPGADPNTEVGQVALSVNTLLQAVETEFAARLRSEERMRQFLADASHELRTPLTSIRGYAELARMRAQPTDAPDDSMRRIEVEGTRMSRLVEDLLVLARGDQGAVARRELVEVDQLLAETASAVRAAHPDRQLLIARPTGLVVSGDRDQLLRVLLNLATNAAVHTPPNGPIRLDAVPGRTPTGPAVALQVIDTGPGLTPDEAEHVFERFWRADKARSRAKGGSGLGMAIVAQIVQAHGGQVRFDSTVEHGTTVTVTLPLAESAGSPTAD
jgi:two-component system OmpR family sensor kinase